jgi:hypothetical protein
MLYKQLKITTLDVPSEFGGKARTFAMLKNHCTLLSGLMAVDLWACLPPTPLCVLITA